MIKIQRTIRIIIAIIIKTKVLVMIMVIEVITEVMFYYCIFKTSFNIG